MTGVPACLCTPLERKLLSVQSNAVLCTLLQPCMHRMTIGMYHPAGNLLNSLMGSGEEDDVGEEAQEDSSPIELD